MQVYFATRVRLAGEQMAANDKVGEREGWGCGVVRAIRSLSLIGFLMLYAFNPLWLSVLSVPFPVWIRWIGVGLGGLSLAFYGWSRATLGKEWSSPLQIHQKQHLVTTGPYAWIRHPIYIALLSFLSSIALVGANWFLVALLAFSIVDLVLRIRKEEQMLIEKFGDEYKAYMESELTPKNRAGGFEEFRSLPASPGG